MISCPVPTQLSIFSTSALIKSSSPSRSPRTSIVVRVGLSISTDKKVKAGGIYYILSRSLGLPMGGAIGIALFVGTALSISLYIVGFTESFLSIPSIREALGLGTTKADIRIVGTTVIMLLVIMVHG